MLWLIMAACFTISLWYAFWIIKAVIWILDPVLD